MSGCDSKLSVYEQTVKGEKNYQPVSRILCPAVRRAVIIYLAPALLQGSSCLPSGIGRTVLYRRYTWHFSMQGLPVPAITCRDRGLLPHVFNLTLPFLSFGGKREAVMFCGTISCRFNATRLLTGALSYAVRTFLPLHKQRAMTRLVAGKGKISCSN